jgi:hypothetical protein
MRCCCDTNMVDVGVDWLSASVGWTHCEMFSSLTLLTPHDDEVRLVPVYES